MAIFANTVDFIPNVESLERGTVAIPQLPSNFQPDEPDAGSAPDLSRVQDRLGLTAQQITDMGRPAWSSYYHAQRKDAYDAFLDDNGSDVYIDAVRETNRSLYKRLPADSQIKVHRICDLVRRFYVLVETNLMHHDVVKDAADDTEGLANCEKSLLLDSLKGSEQSELSTLSSMNTRLTSKISEFEQATKREVASLGFADATEALPNVRALLPIQSELYVLAQQLRPPEQEVLYEFLLSIPGY